jgi:hypothetical protein
MTAPWEPIPYRYAPTVIERNAISGVRAGCILDTHATVNLFQDWREPRTGICRARFDTQLDWRPVARGGEGPFMAGEHHMAGKRPAGNKSGVKIADPA